MANNLGRTANHKQTQMNKKKHTPTNYISRHVDIITTRARISTKHP